MVYNFGKIVVFVLLLFGRVFAWVGFWIYEEYDIRRHEHLRRNNLHIRIGYMVDLLIFISIHSFSLILDDLCYLYSLHLRYHFYRKRPQHMSQGKYSETYYYNEKLPTI